MKSCERRCYKIGDVVRFHKAAYVVLDSFKVGESVYRYTVFSPACGVYTVFNDELELLCHSKEADALVRFLKQDEEKLKSA